MTEVNVIFNCHCGVKAIIASDGCWVCPKCQREITKQICRSGCSTQDHNTYWECLQAANVSIDKTSLRSD